MVLVKVLKKCFINFWLNESIYDIKIKKDLEIMFCVKERRFVAFLFTNVGDVKCCCTWDDYEIDDAWQAIDVMSMEWIHYFFN